MLPEPQFPLETSARERHLALLRKTLRDRAESFVGTLEYLRGEAEIFDAALNRSRAIEAGVRLAKGTRLTIKSGRALVRLDDGSDVWLAEGATVDFSAWSASSRTFRALGGKFLALVAEQAGAPFRALTPFGDVCVAGTAFEADASREALSVTVLHGGVLVSNALGAVRVRQGRGARSTPAEAPSTFRSAPSADAWKDWATDLAASSSNARVRPAYNAAAKTLGLPRAPRVRKDIMNNSKFGSVALVFVLLALAGGGYLYAQGGSKSVAAIPGLAPQSSKVSVTGADGQKLDIDPTSANAVDQILAKIPAEKHEKLRPMLQKHIGEMADGKAGDTKLNVQVMPDGKVALMVEKSDDRGEAFNQSMPSGMDRDIAAGRQMHSDLIASGMSEEQARATVQAALADSITKQEQARHGDDANVQARVNLGGPGADGEERASVWVTVKKEGPEGPSEDTNVDVVVRPGLKP
jgi:hypothetical protein